MNNDDLFFAFCILWWVVALFFAIGNWIRSIIGGSTEIDPYDFQQGKGVEK